MGWFYGFKLHLVINDEGGLLSVKVTTGNVDGRIPVAEMCENLWGTLYGGKGYISKKFTDELSEQGIHFVTGKNMKPKTIEAWSKLLLKSDLSSKQSLTN